ncbi:anionic trypsin-2-like [Myripristis murdjan]|uniref:anionic trypsin-2-like n=1 Tax=Myripristis murdjan TaxID=586833 RepID=UPI001176131D|nr:anionic trypsin-2-like [Myripristis murdjan]
MAQLLLLLLLLWADFTVGDVHKRIIGGQPCQPDERQYHVLLRARDTLNNDVDFCGGSLISDQWILTASHCWYSEPGWTMRANLTVHPGPGLDVPLQNDPQHRIPFIDNQGQHDIMLLRLTTPVNNPHTIPVPACNDANAARLRNVNNHESVQIAGKAATHAGPGNVKDPAEEPEPDLQCVDVNVADCRVITHQFPGQTPIQNQHHFCGQGSDVDACVGDSGGGVVYGGKIYGVISTIDQR